MEGPSEAVSAQPAASSPALAAHNEIESQARAASPPQATDSAGDSAIPAGLEPAQSVREGLAEPESNPEPALEPAKTEQISETPALKEAEGGSVDSAQPPPPPQASSDGTSESRTEHAAPESASKAAGPATITISDADTTAATSATASTATPGTETRPATDNPTEGGTTAAQSGHEHQPPAPPAPHFVAPSSYLRFKMTHGGAMLAAPTPAPAPEPTPSPLEKEQRQGLKAIRDFLKKRTSYDVLPLSFRLIVLDTDLLIKKSLNILIQNSIVSAPLWDSHTSRFAGILTATDYINVIQYHCQFPDEMSKLDQFRLSSLRDIEKAIGAKPIESMSVHPDRPLYEALGRMLNTRARRIPLVDVDDETGRETVISVITQYRILKFIAVNNEHNTVLLKQPVRDIEMGTYKNLAVANMNTTVLEVINMMVSHNISCVPIVDSQNRLLNAFEAVDVIPCIKGGAYDDLNGTVGEALSKRPDDSPGIYTCSEDDRLDSIFDTVRKSRVHRLIVVDDENKLKGVVSLSDILKYVLLYGEEEMSHS